jgi:hypothetical protein
MLIIVIDSNDLGKVISKLSALIVSGHTLNFLPYFHV